MPQIVYFRTTYPVGTIIINRPQTFLYVVRPRLAAMRYTIDVDSDCAKLIGLYRVVRKEEWPGENAPPKHASDTADKRTMIALGARALDLDQNFRIHSASAPPPRESEALKRCIALANDDMIKLYDRTPVGNRVVVLSQ